MARPENTIEKVLRTKLPIKGKLLLAVSGGKDSVALFHGCLELKDKYKLKLGVAHVDHALRKNSAKDAAFVKKLAKKHHIPYFETRLKKTSKKENTEAWGRKERYKFFSGIVKKEKYDWLLTAHTANDVAETFLIRLLSNKELNSIDSQDKGRRLLRPFLNVSTEEVYRYIKANKLKFVEDETNSENKFLRNKIRNKLLPMLAKEFDKRIAETICTRAVELQEDLKGLAAMCAEDLGSLSKHKFGTKQWLRAVRAQIKDMPEVLAWRLAEGLFKPLLGFDLGSVKSKELLRFIKGEIQGIQLPGGLRAKFKGGGIELIRQA